MTTPKIETRERWMRVPNHPRYEVSDQGRVRSYVRRGKFGGTVEDPRYLKTSKHCQGYLTVAIDGETILVQRLVLLAFVGNPPEGKNDAAHLNGIRTDNRLDNLMWCSRKENCDHRVGHGTLRWGDLHKGTRIKLSLASQIRDEYRNGSVSQRSLAAKYKVTQHTIGNIINGHVWNGKNLSFTREKTEAAHLREYASHLQEWYSNHKDQSIRSKGQEAMAKILDIVDSLPPLPEES